MTPISLLMSRGIMRFFLFSFLLFALVSCSTSDKKIQEDLRIEITEIHPNKWTGITKQNLIHLFQVYDLDPYLYTRKIQIQSKVIPHSHPILTLNTRNAEKPKKLLAGFLHEELHWFANKNGKNVNKAIAELKKVYPTVPLEGGAKNPQSTYFHLIICYLEFKSVAHYLGEKEARMILEDFIRKEKIYPWIYTQVLNKNFAIKRVVHKYRLLPEALH